MVGKLRASFALVALATGACTSMPYKIPVIEAMSPAAPRFAGLRELAPGKPLKVLVVHGMCTHNQLWVDEWRRAMTASFGNAGVARPSPQVGAIQTQRVDFADDGRTVEVTFAVWSGATAWPKLSLAYDSSPNFPFKRAKFNDAAKSWLINDCFADPVIYSGSQAPGSVGALLRRDMAALVCGFAGGRWEGDQCNGGDTVDKAFITESLGSKMLTDAVARLAEGPRGGDMRASMARTHAIYMLANQLPLLRLADAGTSAQLRQLDTAELRYFGGSPGRDGVASDIRVRLQVVAFTDPNDQFGYRLTHASIGENPDRVALFNVIVSNAKTWFGLAENPLPAHVGYWKNPRVPPLVLQGGQATR